MITQIDSFDVVVDATQSARIVASFSSHKGAYKKESVQTGILCLLLLVHVFVDPTPGHADSATAHLLGCCGRAIRPVAIAQDSLKSSESWLSKLITGY